MKEFKGFTLIELMIAISILAILLVVGVPNFQTSIQNNRMSTSANEFISAIMIARSEAIKRSVNVRVISNNNNTNWANGWTIISDADNNTVFNINPAVSTCATPATDCLLRTTTGLNAGATLRSVINNVTFFEFDPRGRLRLAAAGAAPDTLVMCDGRGFVQGRAIIVTNTGRGRVVSVTDPDASVNGAITGC